MITPTRDVATRTALQVAAVAENATLAAEALNAETTTGMAIGADIRAVTAEIMIAAMTDVMIDVTTAMVAMTEDAAASVMTELEAFPTSAEAVAADEVDSAVVEAVAVTDSVATAKDSARRPAAIPTGCQTLRRTSSCFGSRCVTAPKALPSNWCPTSTE